MNLPTGSTPQIYELIMMIETVNTGLTPMGFRMAKHGELLLVI
jgi:hypothetical protein